MGTYNDHSGLYDPEVRAPVCNRQIFDSNGGHFAEVQMQFGELDEISKQKAWQLLNACVPMVLSIQIVMLKLLLIPTESVSVLAKVIFYTELLIETSYKNYTGNAY